MKTRLIILFVSCCASFIICAQDLHFSNIQSMNQQVIPEFSALNNDLEATVYYRNQWRTIGSKYGAIGASFASTLQKNHKVNGSHLAGGLNFYQEKMNKDASFTSTRFNLVQHQIISKFSKVSLGINLGFQSLAFDPAQGSWGSQHNGLEYDPTMESGESFARNQKTSLDVGSGIIYTLRYKKSSQQLLQVGFSAQHLNRPNLSFNNDRSGILPIKTVGYSSLNLKLGKRGSIFQTSCLFQKQAKFTSVIVGSFFKIKLSEKAKTTSSFGAINEIFVGIGAYYRSSDAFIASLMFQKSNWNISMAYDFTVSNLQSYNYSKGAVEIQLQYTINSFQPYSRY